MISKKEQYSYINCVEEAFYQHKADMKCVVERTSENILAKAKKVDAAKSKFSERKVYSWAINN